MDDPVQEGSWISASQQGDAVAFNRLVLRWEKNVYNIAMRMLQDREEAAETTQEVFLLAFKGIRSFRRGSKFSTWLYRIALNQCVTRFRQRPPGVHLSLDDGDSAIKSVERLQMTETQVGELMRSERQKRVLEALAHLQPDQQAVIELKFFQEMTFEEIAAVLDAPLSTIKSRLYSGLEMLRTRLSNGNLTDGGV
jgi:RNA polymerase sigma-70 factor (ECF subfamily)